MPIHSTGDYWLLNTIATGSQLAHTLWSMRSRLPVEWSSSSGNWSSTSSSCSVVCFFSVTSVPSGLAKHFRSVSSVSMVFRALVVCETSRGPNETSCFCASGDKSTSWMFSTPLLIALTYACGLRHKIWKKRKKRLKNHSTPSPLMALVCFESKENNIKQYSTRSYWAVLAYSWVKWKLINVFKSWRRWRWHTTYYLLI